MDATQPRKPPRPWLFGLTAIPFGISGGYTAVAMPYLLREAGAPMTTIAAVGAATLIPAAWQFLYAPLVDLGIRRRAWLMLLAGGGGVLLAASLLMPLPHALKWFEALCVLGQGVVGLSSSANGGLIATTLPQETRGRVSGWINAANLGGSALGGGLILYLAVSVSRTAAALVMLALCMLPALAALAVHEMPRAAVRIGAHFKAMFRETWRTARSRSGWTGILFCLSPVGTAAMLNLFAALAPNYQVGGGTVEMINGYWGGLVTAAGALATGFVLDRINRRYAYLAAGMLTAVVGICMALAPVDPRVYMIGSLAYLLVAGVCYAAFSAVVFEIIGHAGESASTQYTLFTAAGNQAIAYVTWMDGQGYAHAGEFGLGPSAGMLMTDALANLVGVAVLALLLRVVFKRDARRARA